MTTEYIRKDMIMQVIRHSTKRMVLKNVFDQDSIHKYSYTWDVITNSVQD